MLIDYGEVIENASLLNYNTYGINTSCDYLVKPNNIDNLKALLNYINNNNIKYYILGKGSNVILPDSHFNGIIISLELLNKILFDNEYVTAECGINLSLFVMECINKGLQGLECLALIPGTLGGALVGNAGVRGHEIYDNLISIEVIRNGEIILLNKEDIKVSYRYTSFKDNNDVLVRAMFKLSKIDDISLLKKIVNDNRLKRLESQPLEYRNAGSVFKNPEGHFAGKLIEDVGLKGYNIGGAAVSKKHANFIINEGNATSRDIKELIKYIKEKVYKEYKIDLTLEQIIVEWD